MILSKYPLKMQYHILSTLISHTIYVESLYNELYKATRLFGYIIIFW